MFFQINKYIRIQLLVIISFSIYEKQSLSAAFYFPNYTADTTASNILLFIIISMKSKRLAYIKNLPEIKTPRAYLQDDNQSSKLHHSVQLKRSKILNTIELPALRKQLTEKKPKSIIESKDEIKNLINQKINQRRKKQDEVKGNLISTKSTEILNQSPNLQKIRQNIIGFHQKYISPFGYPVTSLYLDHTATNRPYAQIESIIEQVKKFIANPHTEYSYYGKYSDELMNYSQQSILKSFGTMKQYYFAIPAGSGSTGAIEKATKIINQVIKISDIKSTQVFVTQYQHHSNLLPWIQFYQNVNPLPSEPSGKLDITKIFQFLQKQTCELLIISISGASNVTSQITDLSQMNKIVRKLRESNKNVIFCVDCAAYTPHKKLDLSMYDQIDFVYISPHKNLGGSEACGVLIARKSLYNILMKPTFPGGGTVRYVKGYQQKDVLYEKEGFKSQIAGTPPFIGFYRAALSFQLLNRIGYDFIHNRQKQNVNTFLSLLEQTKKRLKDYKKKIVVYGDTDFSNRANVITFNIFNEEIPVHYNFVSLLFTHLFGIQLRSGCFCAGPFGKHLLQVNDEYMNKVQSQIKVDINKNKPGYLRLDIPFYLEEFQINYIVSCIELIAMYNMNMDTLYTILYNGEIKMHHYLYQPKWKDFFGLQSHQNKNETSIMQSTDRTSIEQILSQQLNYGKKILKNPIEALSNIKRQKLSIQSNETL